MANGTDPRSSATNPFTALPFPSPGERIKADDFRALSQSLRILYELQTLSGSLFGHTLAEARTALTAQRYEVARVMTVFGNELADPKDDAMDQRKVLQILAVSPGESAVLVVLTEVVENRKFAPNLMGLTYHEAGERIRALVGTTAAERPVIAPDWIGRSLAEVHPVT